MTAADLDLTAAIEAGGCAWWHREPGRPPWEYIAEGGRQLIRRRLTPVINAAAPLIAAQVAEQIAREIERARDNDMSSSAWRARQESFTHAARIAREWGAR